MPRLFTKKTALTLTELLVSTAMLGIVIVGVITVDLAIRRMQQVNRASGSVSMRVAAAVVHIVNNASLAVGHRTDPGIILLEGVGAYQALFFRQDLSNTPADYTDDTWVRYIVDLVSGSGTENSLFYCDNILSTADVDPSSCDGTQVELIEVESVDFDFINNLGSLDFYVEINITALPDPSQPADEVTNREYGLATRVSPLGHTF